MKANFGTACSEDASTSLVMPLWALGLDRRTSFPDMLSFSTSEAATCDFRMVILTCSSSESIKDCSRDLVFTNASFWSRGLEIQHIHVQGYAVGSL